MKFLKHILNSLCLQQFFYDLLVGLALVGGCYLEHENFKDTKETKPKYNG
jgi:hypothetical protein